MKVKVTFWSGISKDFIVNDDILQVEFTKIAFDQGGPIKQIQFP